jgi:hypothetical protein
MDKEELDWLEQQVEGMVNDLKTVKSSNKELLAEKKILEERLSSLERQVQRTEKEGDRAADLAAENKAYKKKYALLKTKVASMLAKVEALQ